MRTLLKNAGLILPDRIVKGTVSVNGSTIEAVGEPSGQYDRVWDLGGAYLAPGFVETHTHGAGGADFMDGTAEACVTAVRTHLEHGTTTVYPTLLAASAEEICRGMDAFREAKALLEPEGIALPGVHLEGPFLNPEQKGAINDAYIRNPSREEYLPLLEAYGDVIRRWTVAPELPGALEMGGELHRRGIVASAGHSNASYAEVKAAVENGFTHVTHLYSAMSTITRKGGFRVSGLLESAYCLKDLSVEIIADGCHLPCELLRMVWDLIGPDRAALTCDSMRCAGQDVKESYLGSLESGQPVVIEDDVAKLPDRTAFAGSIATDDRLVRTMVNGAGIPLTDAVRMMTLTPARIMGIEARKGSLEAGKDADLVVLDESLRVRGVMAGGRPQTGILKKEDGSNEGLRTV